MDVEPGDVVRTCGELERRRVGRRWLLARSQWKRYWFVLWGRLLVYYRRAVAGDELLPCRGCINLGTVRSVAIVMAGQQHVLQVGSGVQLRADSRPDLERWLAALLEAAGSTRQPDRLFRLQPHLHRLIRNEHEHEYEEVGYAGPTSLQPTISELRDRLQQRTCPPLHIDRILHELERQRQSPLRPASLPEDANVAQLIRRFDPVPPPPLSPCTTDELNQLLEQLALVTRAPLQKKGRASLPLPLPPPSSADEPDYDVPRPHSATAAPPTHDRLAATRFLGPPSISPDSVEPPTAHPL